MDLSGRITTFKVIRETDISYLLQSLDQNYENEEFFLHKNDTCGKQLKKNDLVDCFLFFDNKHRLAATLQKPNLVLGEIKELRVSSINYEMGVFLDNGISKELLLSKDYLPFNKKYWPKENTYLPVKLKVAKNALKAVLLKEMFKPYKGKINEELNAKLVSYSKDDLILITSDLRKIKVLKNNYLNKINIGDYLTVKITYLGYQDTLGVAYSKDNQSINLIKKQLLRVFETKNDVDYYTREIIEKLFRITKNQFKKYLKELINDNIIKIELKKIYVKGSI